MLYYNTTEWVSPTLIMAARKLCWPPVILFYHCSLDLSLFIFLYSFILSLPNLRGCSADRHQTLPHIWWRPRFIKFDQKFGWHLPHEKHNISHNFTNRSRVSLERNKTSSIGKRRCKLRTLPHKHFGPQTAKNRTGVLTNPTGGYHAGHCHASSLIGFTVKQNV